VWLLRELNVFAQLRIRPSQVWACKCNKITQTTANTSGNLFSGELINTSWDTQHTQFAPETPTWNHMPPSVWRCVEYVGWERREKEKREEFEKGCRTDGGLFPQVLETVWKENLMASWTLKMFRIHTIHSIVLESMFAVENGEEYTSLTECVWLILFYK